VRENIQNISNDKLV